jgi:hypothetical protein
MWQIYCLWIKIKGQDFKKNSPAIFSLLPGILLSVNAVLEDAEDKQFTRLDVKEWLDELKDAVYDAEDTLDKIVTKDLRRKLDTEFGTIESKVRNPISTSRFVRKEERKIEDLLERLDFIVKKRGEFRSKRSCWRESIRKTTHDFFN